MPDADKVTRCPPTLTPKTPATQIRKTRVTSHRLPRLPKKLEPIPGHRAQDEQAMAMILALASELTVTRARLDACERLLVRSGILAAGAIDDYSPDEAAQGERGRLRTRIIAKVLRPLHELAELELTVVKEDRA